MKCLSAILSVLFAAAASSAIAADNRTAILPDFNGQWGHDMVYFEQPLSGPGPVDRLLAPDGTLRPGDAIGDYRSPILKPHAADIVRRLGEVSASGKMFPNPHNQCWPEPPPFVMQTQFGMQILQGRDEVTLIYLFEHNIRHVRLNVPHPANLMPSYYGDSVGHYEGDTLVVDTVGIKVGPYAMIDNFGTPYSRALHLVERYRLIDGEARREAMQRQISHFLPPGRRVGTHYGRGDLDPDMNKKGLRVQLTVEDPEVFTSPWTAFLTFQRVIGDWPEVICAEGAHQVGYESKIPTALKPDF